MRSLNFLLSPYYVQHNAGAAATTAAMNLISPRLPSVLGMLKDPSYSLSCIAGIWSGVVTGISFLEAWVKFRAQTLNLRVAVDVGRTVFWAKERAELVLAGLLVTTAINAPLSPSMCFRY